MRSCVSLRSDSFPPHPPTKQSGVCRPNGHTACGRRAAVTSPRGGWRHTATTHTHKHTVVTLSTPRCVFARAQVLVPVGHTQNFARTMCCPPARMRLLCCRRCGCQCCASSHSRVECGAQSYAQYGHRRAQTHTVHVVFAGARARVCVHKFIERRGMGRGEADDRTYTQTQDDDYDFVSVVRTLQVST